MPGVPISTRIRVRIVSTLLSAHHAAWCIGRCRAGVNPEDAAPPLGAGATPVALRHKRMFMTEQAIEFVYTDSLVAYPYATLNHTSVVSPPPYGGRVAALGEKALRSFVRQTKAGAAMADNDDIVDTISRSGRATSAPTRRRP